MATHIDAAEAQARLAEILQRATERAERFVIEVEGQPAAALVSPEDLKRLEGPEPAVPPEPMAAEELLSPDDLTERETRFWQALADAGVVVRRATGKRLASHERSPIRISAPPISEEIIADRQYRDDLLSGQ